MRIRNSSARLNTGSTDIVEFLEQARVRLRESRGVWADQIGVTEKEYVRFLERRSAVPVHILANLCESFDLSIESVHRGSVDLSVFEARARGERGTLPERYYVGAFSRRRFAAILFDWFEKRLGFYGKTEVMRHFQIDPLTFSNPAAPINICFYAEVMQYVARRFGVRPEEYVAAGMMSYDHVKDTPIGHLLATLRTPDETWDRLTADLQPFFGVNCSYELIENTAEKCVLHGYEREVVRDALRAKTVGNVFTCALNVGFFAVVPKFMGKPSAHVEETRCIHMGDAYCRYELNYVH